MRQYILPETGSFYKANLHSHTTDSDGFLSPEELARAYREHGYSVLAITDHNKFIDRAQLCRDDFLVLNGLEYTPPLPPPRPGRNVHIGMIASSPDITDGPEIIRFNSEDMTDAEYTACVNDAVRRGNDAGFLCIYNHMRWSLDDDRHAHAYQGLFGMEVRNHFSEILGIEDYNLETYRSLLRAGKRLFCIMADDNHNKPGWEVLNLTDIDSLDTSFGAWITIKAPSLTYENIITALKRGDFYCSTGPDITEAYIENGRLYVKCSSARSITLGCAGRRGKCKYKKDGGLTEAVFDIDDLDGFLQIMVKDVYGNIAVTQPYFR